MVKTAVGSTKKALRRERNNYLIPGIRSSPYIRSHWDILEPYSSDDTAQADEMATAPPGMVFEWMEYDLWQVSSERYRQDSILPKVIARSVLSALALLKTQYDAIHTGAWQPVFSLPRQLLINQISIQTIFSFLISTVLLLS